MTQNQPVETPNEATASTTPVTPATPTTPEAAK